MMPFSQIYPAVIPHTKILLVCLICFGVETIVFAQETDPAQTAQRLKKLSIQELMDLEVTSVSKKPEKLKETSSAVQVITQEDIRNSGASSVPEALRLAPNLQVAQVNASQWAISARGFNNVLANKLLVLIDGRVVYTPLYAGVFWDVQNLVLEDIERIEVISGPGGTLWGANAVNGVINIITKSSKDTKGLFVEAGTGAELKGLGSLRYGGQVAENISYRIYGTAFKKDHTIFPDSVDANDSWHMGQAGARLDWDVSEKDLITVQGNLFEGRPDPDGGVPVIASGGNALARWNHKHSERSRYQIQFYYDQTWRDFRNGFAENLKTLDFEAQHQFSLGSRQEVVYGGGVRAMNHHVNNLELFAFLPPEKSLYLYNIFLQDNISIIKEKLKFTAGLKIEHYTYSDFQFQPNARLSWMPNRNVTMWSAVSKAVRNPSRIDREFFLFIAPQVPFIAGHDAKPEELVAYELGWHIQALPTLSLSVATFYNQYDNIRGVGPTEPNVVLPVSFINSVEGNAYGAEFSFRYQVNHWWRIHGGYNYLKKDLSVKEGMTDANNASAESNDPTHQAMMQSSMTWEKFELGGVLRYVGNLPEPYVSEYLDMDLRIGWQLVDQLELSIVGQNLFQDSHAEFIPSSPAPKHIERSGYVKLTCRF